MFAKTLTTAALVLTATQAAVEPWDFHANAASASEDLRAIADANPALSIQETEDGAVDSMVMFSDVLFEFGNSELSPAALETLKVVAKDLGGVAGLKIIGHTDDRGTESRNHALGLNRAKAVRSWIADQTGLDPADIAVDSAGETQPIAANRTDAGADNAEGRALNRRVEFKIIEQAPLEEPPVVASIDTPTEPLADAETGDIVQKAADTVEKEETAVQPSETPADPSASAELKGRYLTDQHTLTTDKTQHQAKALSRIHPATPIAARQGHRPSLQSRAHQLVSRR
ncbi:MAG: OmpA family protein [Paracoccaceae bacterium]